MAREGPPVNSNFIRDCNYASHWSMQDLHFSCCCLCKWAEPKLCVPMIPRAKFFRVCKMLGCPLHALALSCFASLPEWMESSPLHHSFFHVTCGQPPAVQSHDTFRKARNSPECWPKWSTPICLFGNRSKHAFAYRENPALLYMHLKYPNKRLPPQWGFYWK